MVQAAIMQEQNKQNNMHLAAASVDVTCLQGERGLFK